MQIKLYKEHIASGVVHKGITKQFSPFLVLLGSCWQYAVQNGLLFHVITAWSPNDKIILMGVYPVAANSLSLWDSCSLYSSTLHFWKGVEEWIGICGHPADEMASNPSLLSYVCLFCLSCQEDLKNMLIYCKYQTDSYVQYLIQLSCGTLQGK